MKYIQREGIIQPTYLSRLYNLVSKETGFPWFFIADDISYGKEFHDGWKDEELSVGFTHLLLDQDGVESFYLPTFQALLDNISDELGGVTFFRARLALQLNNGKNCPICPIRIMTKTTTVRYIIYMIHQETQYSIMSTMM